MKEHFMEDINKKRKERERLVGEIAFLNRQLAELERKISHVETPEEAVDNGSATDGSSDEEDIPILAPVENLELYFESRAFNKIMEHCRALGKKNLEALGFLIGDKFTYEGHGYTVVKDVVTSKLDSSPVSVRIGDFGPMFEEMDNMDKAGMNYILVGWYHSHPGHTCFLSAVDVSTQKRMFRESFHVAVVADPINRELKAFKLDVEKEYREISYGVCE